MSEKRWAIVTRPDPDTPIGTQNPQFYVCVEALSPSEVAVPVEDLRAALLPASCLDTPENQHDCLRARSRLFALLPPEEPELLPCPFCGGEASIEEFDNDDRHLSWRVACDDCLAEMETMSTRHAIISDWNRRADDHTCWQCGCDIVKASDLTSEEPELLACPFCGAIPELRHVDKYGYKVECAACGAGFPGQYGSRRMVCETWNRRATPAGGAQ